MIEKCVSCVHPGKDCMRRIVSFPAVELLQWCKERKKFLDWSNGEIAEKANVPKGTVDRLFSNQGYTEFRFSTIQPIVCALIGCNPEDFDCDNQSDNDAELRKQIKELEEENRHASERLAKYERIYRDEVEKIRTETKDRISFFKEHVRLLRKALIIVSIVLAISFVLIIALLING